MTIGVNGSTASGQDGLDAQSVSLADYDCKRRPTVVLSSVSGRQTDQALSTADISAGQQSGRH